MDERVKDEYTRDPDEVVALVQKRWKEVRDHWSDWRTEARQSYDIVAGRQWDEDDLELLKQQRRPPVTFNRVAPTIDAVCGSEAQNRQAIKYQPRGMEDVGVATLLNSAAAWVRDRSNADIEENEAFRDSLICGIGCTVTRVSYASNPDGDIEIERQDPLEVYADPASRKRNFVDARYVIAERWISGPDLQEEWPEQAGELTQESRGADQPSSPVDANEQDYQDDTNAHYRPRTNEYRLIQCEWREPQTYYRVLDPQTGKVVDVDVKRWAEITKAMQATGVPPPRAVKARKWSWRRAIVCGEVLLDDGPAPCDTGSSYKFITGVRDRNERIFYGLVRSMKDPQDWANKWLSQIMSIINSNAKGGIIWEAGAFDNPGEAKKEWAKPDAWVRASPGGIGKIQQRAPITYPAGLDNLMQFAVSSIRDVTGVNLEILGLADRQQAGVLESQRKQAALTILAGWFDALRAYRREHGRMLYQFIQKYLADGRLIRIDAENGPQYAPLVQMDETLEYDVIVDSAPASVNVKQQTFETLQAFLPAALKMGMPVPPSVLKYLPIPESLATEWQQMLGGDNIPPQLREQIQQGQQQIAQMGQALQQRDQQLQKMQADLMRSQLALDAAKAQGTINAQDAQVKTLETTIKAQEVKVKEFEAETERLRLALDAQNADDTREITMASERDKTAALLEQVRMLLEKPVEFKQRGEMEQIVSQAIAPMAEQIMAMVRAELNKPKTLEYGNDGLVVSMNGRPVVRAPDGRIVGIQ
jgi:hypothetical protein